MTSRHPIKIDPDHYARVSGVFDASRRSLTPDAVEGLAREVLARLAAHHRDAAAPRAAADGAPDPVLVAAFCDALLLPDRTAPLRFVNEVLAQIVSDRDGFLNHVAAASRMLGARWDADTVTFVEVASSVGKLYTLVRAARSAAAGQTRSTDPRKTALFAPVPGERHTLGVTIAAELFREAGWDIDLQVEGTHDTLVARAERLRPAVIGLSVSASSGLDGLARLVAALRLAVPGALVAVAASGGMDADALRRMIDLDLVVTDARQARRELAHLLGLPPGDA